MAQSTLTRARGSRTSGSRTGSRRGAPTRSPELDLSRAVALGLAVVVVTAPGRLPTWLEPTGAGLTLGDVLPAVFAVIAGAALAHQAAAHASAGARWWAARLARRLAILVGVGVALRLLVDPVTSVAALRGVRLTSDLARIGVAGVLALPLVGIAPRARLALAAVLVALHHALLASGPGALADGGAYATWDARLLGGRALSPVDPDGVTMLLATVALVLVGTVVADWLRARPRGGMTAALLLVGAGLTAAAATTLAGVTPALPAVWTAPVLLGGTAVAAGLLAVGHAGTRVSLTDRWVATLGLAGRVTLPLWGVTVLGHAWFGGTPPLRWLLEAVLWPPLGSRWAPFALGVLVAAAILRLGVALSDRGLAWRA